MSHCSRAGRVSNRWALGAGCRCARKPSGSRRRRTERAGLAAAGAGRAAAGAAGDRWELGARQQGRQGHAAARAAGARSSRGGRGAWGVRFGRAASAHLGVLSWARLGFCAL